MADTTIAFDFGGTKIDIRRMRPDGSFAFSSRAATADLGPGRPGFLDAALELIARHVSDQDRKIGLSWNAPVHEGRLTQSSLLGGRVEVDLAGQLAQRFSQQVQVESDVHAMALGERRFGIGSGVSSFVVVNMGSGSGIAYHDSSLMRGAAGGAGLVSQERFYVAEIDEWLIMDNLLSGRGVTLLYQRLTGRTRTAVDLHSLAATDSAARKVFQLIGLYLGRFIVKLARILNPQCFVLCGSVARAAPLFIDITRDVVRSEIEPACLPTAILPSELEAAACLGLL